MSELMARAAARLRELGDGVLADEVDAAVGLLTPPDATEAWFFGVAAGSSAGHYLIGRYRQHYRGWPLPGGHMQFGGRLLDCDDERGLCPPNTHKQGDAYLWHFDDWSALCLWDRSGDSRGGSNSNFFFRLPKLHPAQALQAARTLFPQEMERIEAAGSIQFHATGRCA